jgi:hypothetical protein
MEDNGDIAMPSIDGMKSHGYLLMWPICDEKEGLSEAQLIEFGSVVESTALDSIFLEAMRRVGEMLRETDRATGAAGIGVSKSAVPEKYHTQPEIGLTKKESALAQKLAALPPEDKSR